jgi:hypothetical protein
MADAASSVFRLESILIPKGDNSTPGQQEH